MILHPSIVALLLGSFLSLVLVLYAGWHGGRILVSWDLESGSELQLSLERRTYLVSTLVVYLLFFELASLFLYVFCADELHGLFAGAMCAAGTLNVNPYGYPLLALKLFDFLLASAWLVLNHADNKGYDYPLIRYKYALLLALVPFLLGEFVLLVAYFTGLHADVITSCCGALFSRERPGVGGDLASLPVKTMQGAWGAALAVTALSGGWFYLKGKGGHLFSLASFSLLIVSLASVISFICLYFYELPSHHCPFCLLQKEYGRIGFLLYASLLGGGAAGLGVGVLMPFRGKGSMAKVIPALQRRLTLVALGLYVIFAGTVAVRILTTSFQLG